MASSKEFRDFILEQLSELGGIECKPMMGEFLLYHNGILFGGIYDDRFLVKTTQSNECYALEKAIPYKNGKPMYMIENIDEPQYLAEVIKATCNGLKMH